MPCFPLLIAAILIAAAPAFAQAPLGQAPAYSQRALTPVPNAPAMTRLIWVPGIDDGYVPQGLTYLGGALFVSSYLSTSILQDRGPCRLYRINPGTGAVTGQMDLPSTCGHAGGIAKGRRGHIVVADTRIIFEIALDQGAGIGRVTRSAKLTGQVKGSFAAGAADGLWLGAYERDGSSRIFKFLWKTLGKETLGEADAAASLPLPERAQGAAFDEAGRLWIMSSGSRSGELARLDSAGAVEARYAMPAGSEDISFEPGGALWSLSEAGSRRWSGWATHFPVIFRLDVKKLR